MSFTRTSSEITNIIAEYSHLRGLYARLGATTVSLNQENTSLVFQFRSDRFENK